MKGTSRKETTSDPRTIVSPNLSQPYSGICYLIHSETQEYIGTGWIYYNPDVSHSNPADTDYTLVITAGHVIANYLGLDLEAKPESKKEDFNSKIIIIPPNGGNDNSLGISSIDLGTLPHKNKMLFLTRNFIHGSKSPADDYGAILIKQNAVNPKTWQWTIRKPPVITPAASTMAGYDNDYLMYLSGGSVTTNEDRTCDYQFYTSSQQSGAPIWTMQDDGTNGGYYAAIGVHNQSADGIGHGASLVDVCSNFKRWLNPLSSPDWMLNESTKNPSFTLQKEDDWYVDETEVNCDPHMVVTGMNLVLKKSDHNFIGLRVTMSTLNGKYHIAKTSSGQWLKSNIDPHQGGPWFHIISNFFSKWQKGHPRTNSFEMPSGHNRYFYKGPARAPKGQVVIGAKLFGEEREVDGEMRPFMGIKLKCAPLGKEKSAKWVDPDNKTPDNRKNYWTIGKHHDGVFDSTEIMSDINFTAVTEVALDRPSETDGRVSTKVTTNVFYPNSGE